jgi:arsenite methyltransferase
LGVVRAIAGQFAHPHGRGASLIAPVLNIVNRATNRAVVDILDPVPGDEVVDLGFGGGVAVKLLLERLKPNGRVIAVEPSPEIRRRAERRFRRALRVGALEIADGSASSMPLGAASVDGLVTVNTTYFWDDIAAGIEECRRVLRPGGRLVIGVRPSALASHVRYYGEPAPLGPEGLAALLDAADFSRVEIRKPAKDTVTVSAYAE